MTKIFGNSNFIYIYIKCILFTYIFLYKYIGYKCTFEYDLNATLHMHLSLAIVSDETTWSPYLIFKMKRNSTKHYVVFVRSRKKNQKIKKSD